LGTVSTFLNLPYARHWRIASQNLPLISHPETLRVETKMSKNVSLTCRPQETKPVKSQRKFSFTKKFPSRVTGCGNVTNAVRSWLLQRPEIRKRIFNGDIHLCYPQDADGKFTLSLDRLYPKTWIRLFSGTKPKPMTFPMPISETSRMGYTHAFVQSLTPPAFFPFFVLFEDC
jgi:hypothetical protein